MGFRWVAYRTWYALRKKSGALRRATPTVAIDSLSLSDLAGSSSLTDPGSAKHFIEQHAGRFLFNFGRMPDRTLLRDTAGDEGVARTLAIANDYAAGNFLYYSRKLVDHGNPVNWLHVPGARTSHHARTHWSDYPTFSPDFGDVKTVWEPSRFACAFWLARAYAFSADEKYPEAYWRLLESWAVQNPPNMGPNWKCGQEASLRAFAWIFALHAFWNSPATTPVRVALALKLLAITAERVAANIDFAVSQKNNHGISEAVGLFTIGTLFPFLRRAAGWRSLGRRTLEREVSRQIYDDGSFVQHSMNYHRVMLHDCLWAMRIAELAGEPLSAELRSRVALAGEFLLGMLDPDSGRVPNYGSNDGALILPLDACDYTDFRPVVQAAIFAGTGTRVLFAGPWDEAAVWLFGSAFASTRQTPRPTASARFDAGGYYTIRGTHTWCMARCHSYRDRPAHVDPLHLDIWYRGANVVSDSGSFLYYSPAAPQFEKFFKDISAHNTIEIGGRGPLDPASRFLWVPWPEARCIRHGSAQWSGEHQGYNRHPWNVMHRRDVELRADREWVVTDHLTGIGEYPVVLRWHLADASFVLHAEQRWIELNHSEGKIRFGFELPDGMRIDVRRGDDSSSGVMGWQSEYYGEKSARPTIELNGRVLLPIKIVTRISLGSDARA